MRAALLNFELHSSHQIVLQANQSEEAILSDNNITSLKISARANNNLGSSSAGDPRLSVEGGQDNSEAGNINMDIRIMDFHKESLNNSINSQ